MNTTKVVATRDFTVGPYRKLVIAEGAVREVTLSGPRGGFWTLTDAGNCFGSCQVGDGWKIVTEQDTKD